MCTDAGVTRRALRRRSVSMLRSLGHTVHASWVHAKGDYHLMVQGKTFVRTCLPNSTVLRADARVVVRNIDDDERVELDLRVTVCVCVCVCVCVR